MRSLRKYILMLGISLDVLNVHAQQTIQFSQYVFNGLAVNPAYAGYKDSWTINLSSRIQWVGINDAPQTGTASIDGLPNSNNKNVGLGFIATFDRLGPENISSLYANYAYRLRLDNEDTKRLCFGFAVGAEQYSIDGSKFNATDTGDGAIPLGVESKFTPDFRVGLYYYSPGAYFGASVFNLLSGFGIKTIDNTQVVQLVRTAYVTGGVLLPLSDHIDLRPSIMIKEDFKGPTNVDISSYILFSKVIWLGASYRTGVSIWNKNSLQSIADNEDAIAAMAQFYINDHFRVGYSFDFTTSKLANYQSGSHEISISLTLPDKKPRIISPRYF
jgi:type IX secretion system PorP/SprF family membrane protein